MSLARTPTGAAMLSMVVCHCGPIEEGEQLLYPLRTFQSPMDDGIKPLPYMLQSALDQRFPSGRLHYWKSGWLRDLTDGAIETLLQSLPLMPSFASSVGLHRCTEWRAVSPHRLPPSPHRAEHYDFLILSQWSDPTDSHRNIAWTRALFQAMQPYLEESVYVNNPR